MSNFFTKFAANTFASKSKAHLFQPKAINLYFPNAVHPEFVSLNLTNLSAVSFHIQEITDRSEFVLFAQMHSYNHVQDMDISSFKTREDAQAALDEIRVNLYAPAKSFVKWASLLVFVGGLVCLGYCHKNAFMMHSEIISVAPTQGTTPTTSQANPTPATPNMEITPTAKAGIIMPPMVPGNPANIPPPVNAAEIDAMITQLQQVKQMQENIKNGVPPQVQLQQQIQQAQQPMAQPQPAEQQEAPLSPAEQFLKGMK